jgi:hypothetical protein
MVDRSDQLLKVEAKDGSVGQFWRFGKCLDDGVLDLLLQSVNLMQIGSVDGQVQQRNASVKINAVIIYVDLVQRLVNLEVLALHRNSSTLTALQQGQEGHLPLPA